MALGLHVANDIAAAVLAHYVKGQPLYQTIQEKPLLEVLNGVKKAFPGGDQYIKDRVKGKLMYEGEANFFKGYSEDDEIVFTQAEDIQELEFKWYEVTSGFIITWTELKKDGITISDNNKKSDHSSVERLASLLEDRMEDWAESWRVCFNLMLWKNGAQDAKQAPGLLSIINDDVAVGSVGGLSKLDNAWWRHRYAANLAVSESEQKLTKFLRKEARQIRRFGGRPNLPLAGSEFIDALEHEVQAKGTYTTEGFTRTNDITMGDVIIMKGVGAVRYDPTMDDLGMAHYCVLLDTRRLRLRPMQDEENKVINPDKPYNYMVFLKQMTWTGALTCNQLNCHGLYSVPAVPA